MKKITIKTPGLILYGTISKARSTCGNPSCRCHKNIKYRHGPYYRWTGLIHGKPTTKTISKEVAKECQKRIKNYKTFQKQLKKILDASITNAPWN